MIWFFLKLSAVFRKCLYFKKYTWRIIGWDFRITSVCPIFFLVLEFKITLILETHLKTKDLNLIFNLSCIVGGPNFASANSRQGPFLIFKQNRCTCNNALAKMVLGDNWSDGRTVLEVCPFCFSRVSLET